MAGSTRKLKKNCLSIHYRQTYARGGTSKPRSALALSVGRCGRATSRLSASTIYLFVFRPGEPTCLPLVNYCLNVERQHVVQKSVQAREREMESVVETVREGG